MTPIVMITAGVLATVLGWLVGCSWSNHRHQMILEDQVMGQQEITDSYDRVQVLHKANVINLRLQISNLEDQVKLWKQAAGVNTDQLTSKTHGQ